MSAFYRDSAAALRGGMPKTLAKLLDDPRVDEVEDDRPDDNGYWLYLSDGFYSPYMECRTIHEDTVARCLEVLRDVQPCDPKREF